MGPELDKTPLTFGLQLRRRFGDVFSLQQIWRPVVVLNGLAAVREALVSHSHETSDRPPVFILEHLGYGPRSEGKQWRGWTAPWWDWASSDPIPAGPGGGRAVDVGCKKSQRI